MLSLPRNIATWRSRKLIIKIIWIVTCFITFEVAVTFIDLVSISLEYDTKSLL